MKIKYDISKVMEYFYEISKIPRMSGKEEKIANYIEQFAQKRNLKCTKDEHNNLIIIKEASKGYNNSDSVMLQAHLDMVCEKEESSQHDFENDALNLYIDGDFIKAKGTTLGADNGIGVAVILAILDSKEIRHPDIEAIFTVREETDMLGAKVIDTSQLKSNKMICLDNMSEEELWTGCAGAKVYQYNIVVNKKKVSEDYKLVTIGLSGFIGGHSGKDISKKRGNPIKEMGNLLRVLSDKYNILLKEIYGGNKVNVIPRECYSDIYVKDKDLSKINQEIIKFNDNLKEKIEENTQNIKVSITEKDEKDNICFDINSMRKIIDAINAMPNGAYYSDKYNNPLVSLNVGKIENDDKVIKLYFSIRSNRSKIESELLNELELIVNKYNIEDILLDKLAGYEHKEKSNFIEKCREIYNEYFEKEPKVIDMHICLEAGFFGQKVPNLDFIAISPDIFDAHSPKERCSISSLKRVYNYIILILENM